MLKQGFKFTLILILAALVIPARAQDRLKVYAGFSNLSGEVTGENVKGVNLAGQVRLYSYETLKVEAVGDFGVGVRSPGVEVYQGLAGPQVSLDLLDGRVTPFVRSLFGVTRQTGQSFYTHSIGGGLDINFGKVFVRPLQLDSQTIDTLPLHVRRIGGGVGIRF